VDIVKTSYSNRRQGCRRTKPFSGFLLRTSYYTPLSRLSIVRIASSATVVFNFEPGFPVRKRRFAWVFDKKKRGLRPLVSSPAWRQARFVSFRFSACRLYVPQKAQAAHNRLRDWEASSNEQPCLPAQRGPPGAGGRGRLFADLFSIDTSLVISFLY
jgi:hypothetical protein